MDVDVVGFFDRVSHDRLTARLARRNALEHGCAPGDDFISPGGDEISFDETDANVVSFGPKARTQKDSRR